MVNHYDYQATITFLKRRSGLTHLVQLTLQLTHLGLHLLLPVLPSLFALCNCSVHLYPELCSETILALCPEGMHQEETGGRVNLHAELLLISHHTVLFGCATQV